uniref:Zinc finger protein CONSTANS-LIKE 4 n=1 Tax=Cajanus cajan TaxID=3821 RepID=A0A151TJS9_CAJCA|nr:Zinc finger protein CONSTANS-LIKE 4 [Cajanus cajan]
MSAYNHHPLSHAYETASNFIHRSFSCNSFEGNTFEAHPHTFMQWHSPENTFFTGQIRRVCSTGDLQSAKATDVCRTEEGNLKVGRYSAEERQQKISKYRAKRSQRKFNKIIKYACRKTLADNRTRIRGRFARNEEIKVSSSTSTIEECEDEFWVNNIGSSYIALLLLLETTFTYSYFLYIG